MTEEEWLGCESPVSDVANLRREHHVSTRRMTLFGCACVSRISSLLDDDRCHQALLVTERCADSLPVPITREQATQDSLNARDEFAGNLFARDAAFQLARDHILTAVQAAAWAVTSPNGKRLKGEQYQAVRGGELREQRLIALDIFGNPFRPVTLDPRWQTETVVALASAIYAERAFDRMPILADALQDAGCDHADILAHCRGDGPHVRGCWVIDKILGKE
jgi:hypothetical protein